MRNRRQGKRHEKGDDCWSHCRILGTMFDLIKHSDTGDRPVFRRQVTVLLCILLAGCGSQPPVVDATTPSYAGGMPVDLSGSWERDYARSDDA